MNRSAQGILGTTRARRRAGVAVVVLALAVGACGKSSTVKPLTATTGATSTTAAPAATTTTSAPTTTEAAGISSYKDVQPAVIQIEARGTFRDPEVGYANGSGRGSGFIISPDGLAVTNNHVVTGAATLEIFIGGDTTHSYNATVLGVSECNDLALIKINDPDPLPYLKWYDGEIAAGTDVYAAGFPLGDPEFTLTRGIVAKAKAGGDLTGTSSIDHTIEHDAAIQPGNSGGPLVGTDGTVIGINYAGGAQVTTTEQFYAIAADLAAPVIDQLKDGDFESLGLNGWAVVDDSQGLAGIWVAGVAPGSPASKADILPGDIITAMNGLPVGTDGTFKDYCDVIRTAGEGKPIAVEVLRFDTQEVLKGEINGDHPIELSYSFAQEVEQEVTQEQGPSATVPAGQAYTYESIVDNTGLLTVDVPVQWASRDLSVFTLNDGSEVPHLAASTDIDTFHSGWTVPGIEFIALPRTDDIDGTLALFADPESCTDGGIFDYDDGVYVGKYQIWGDCGGTSTVGVVLVANGPDSIYTVAMGAQLISDSDFDALQQAMNTFYVSA